MVVMLPPLADPGMVVRGMGGMGGQHGVKSGDFVEEDLEASCAEGRKTNSVATETLAACQRRKANFPGDPVGDDEDRRLVDAIRACGGYYFAISEGQSMFVPKGWWHWLMNAAPQFGAKAQLQDPKTWHLSILWSASVF